MQTEQEVKQRRPFHETIVDAIHCASSNELVCLATLIKTTKIPRGHDEIMEVWNQRMQELGWPYMDLGVLADLLEQKQEAENKEKEERAKEQTPASIF